MMKSQSSQVPPEMMDAFEYLLGKIELRMTGTQEEVVDAPEEQAPEIEEEEEEVQPEEAQMLKLTPNQQAQADTLLDSLIGKDHSELKWCTELCLLYQ